MHSFTSSGVGLHQTGGAMGVRKEGRDASPEDRDGVLLLVKIEGTKGRHGAYAWERPIPPPYETPEPWTQTE